MSGGASLPGRAGSMAGSLVAASRALGYKPGEVEDLVRVFELTMKPRIAGLEDDHHPAYLHPGRSALILLHDVGHVDWSTLVVALVLETVDPRLRVALDGFGDVVDDTILDVIGGIPAPGDERLLERLVTLGQGTSLATLAERLDHLRHLHLRDDLRASWADWHEEVLGAWLPFARRTHPKIATRYTHWARTFVKRI